MMPARSFDLKAPRDLLLATVAFKFASYALTFSTAVMKEKLQSANAEEPQPTNEN